MRLHPNCNGNRHRRIQGGANGAETPLNFFRYLFWSMVPDTETSIGVIFCIAFKYTIS